MVCTVVFHLMVNSSDEGWDVIKSKMLGNMKLVEEMKGIKMEEISKN
jgi:hypothetical protein